MNDVRIARRLPALSALALLVAPLGAQVSSSVGPPQAPVGCPIQITLSNDTGVAVATGICPFEIQDAAGNLVFAPACIEILVFIQPGDTFTTQWDQVDQNGNQVPPGSYQVRVNEPDGDVEFHKVEIGGTAAAIAPLGVAKTGTNRSYQLCSPGDPGRPYRLAASFTNAVGISTCAGTVPLDLDGLFFLSQSTPGVFQNFAGVLDATGASAAPSIAIPAQPGLVGTSFQLAFVVLDSPGAPCGIRTISSNLPVTIQ